jgi:anti-sigma factor RsiW
VRCSEARETITAFLDGALTAGEQSELRDHLAGCPQCSRVLEEIRETIGMLGAWAPESAPENGTDSEIARRLLASPAVARPFQFQARWWVAAGFAAALLGFAMGLLLEQRSAPSLPERTGTVPSLADEFHPLPFDPAFLTSPEQR